MSQPPSSLQALRPATDAPLDLYRDADRPARPGRPWVLANFVAGVDGAISVEGRVGSLSSPTDKAIFRLLRSLSDVVLVGAGTFRAERYAPSRLADHLREERRRRGKPPVPPIAVVSASLDLDLDAPVFTDAEVPTLVVTTASSDPDRRARVAQVADVVLAGESRFDPAKALRGLAERGHEVVLCEGGGVLNAELLAAGLLDELCLTLSPHLGGDPSRIVADAPPIPFAELQLAHVLADGDDLFLRYLTGGGRG